MIYSKKRIIGLTSALLLSLITLFNVIGSSPTYAAQLVEGSLTLQPTTGTNGNLPGALANDLFGFTPLTASTVGSIQFLYCTTPSGTCTVPVGMDSTFSTLGSQVGASGFHLVNTTNGDPYISRTPSAVSPGTALSYQLLNVVNPTTDNQTFYVRISTYTSTDATGPSVDSGVVSANIFTYPPVAVVEAENMTLPAQSVVINDSYASNGEAVQMNKQAALKGKVTLASTSTSLSVRLKANLCSVQSPNFSLTIDGVNVLSHSIVTSTYYINVPVSGLNLVPGVHKISLTGSNLGYGTNCTRPLTIDDINFYN